MHDTPSFQPRSHSFGALPSTLGSARSLSEPGNSGTDAEISTLKPFLLFISSFVWFCCWLLLPHRAGADADYWISKAEQQFREGDKAGALECFQRASWERPQDAVLHYNMGVIAESLGRLDEAVDSYLSYLRWDRGSPDRESIQRRAFLLAGRLGNLSYQKRDFRTAGEWYDKARQLYPESKAVYFNLAKVYESLGDLKNAEAAYRHYWGLCQGTDQEEAAKGLAALLRRRAEDLLQKRQYQAALPAFQEARKWDEADAHLLLGQARCEEGVGQIAEAAEHFAEFLRLEPESPEKGEVVAQLDSLTARMAESYLASGDPAKAEAVLTRALAIDPQNAQLHVLLGRSYAQRDRPEDSLAQLEQAVRLAAGGAGRTYTPELVSQCLALADASFRREDYRSALRFLERAQSADPDNPLVAFNLAETYAGLKKWKPAIEEYLKYLSLAPNAPERSEVKQKMAYAYYVFGAELYRQGNYAEAQEAFQQALLVRPQDPALLYNLGLVLEKRGKYKAAIHFWERYLQYEKDPEEIRLVQEEMARLLRQSGEEVASTRVGPPPMPTETGALALPEPNSALGFRQQAFYMLQAGRWEEAIGLYEQHLSRFPADGNDENLREEISRAYRELSRAALLEGNVAKAIASLEKAREWAPAEAISYLWEGSVYESLRRPEEALRIYQRSLRLVQNAEDRRAIQAKIAGLMTQQFEEALAQKEYPEALRILSESSPYLDSAQRQEVHYQRARIESAMGQADEALVEYGLHLKNAPNALSNPRVLDEIASQAGARPELRSVLENPELATREARNAAARGEHGQAVFYTLVAMRDSSQRQNLEPDLLRSARAAGIALSPTEVLSEGSSGVPAAFTEEERLVVAEQARSQLRELYRQGLYEEGLDLLRRVQLLAPGEEFALMEGAFEEMLGHNDDAIDQYRRVLPGAGALPTGLADSIRDQLCDLLIRKAIGEYDAGHLRESLGLLEQAERLSPYRRDIAFDLGCVYLKAREPYKALDAFTKYLGLSGEDSPRKTLTGKAVAILKREISRTSAVRYDKRGVKVDLVFEKPGSLGQLLSHETTDAGPSRQGFLDQVVLAPYLERPIDRQAREELFLLGN